MSNEITCFVKDPIQCDKCTSQAEYTCPYCSMLGHPVNVCENHGVSTSKGLRCYSCGKKIHRIQPRFVGSYSKMSKYIENRPRKEMKKPNVHGVNEEPNRIPRSDLL